MSLKRRFLGWDAPITSKVRDYVLPAKLSGPVDLGSILVVVPTRQAGRRLREAIALYCASQGAVALSLKVVVPTFFLLSDERPASVASQIQVDAVWASVLMEVKPADYKALFPAPPAKRELNWAIKTSKMIQRLRDTLVDGGFLITDLLRDHHALLQESERWRDLASLEEIYLQRLDTHGLKDPCLFMIERSKNPVLPEGVEKIIIASISDPTPLMIKALEKLADRFPVDILVHAPEILKDSFDTWGRPLSEKWCDVALDIPRPKENIMLAGSPVSQSRRVLELIAEEPDRFGPADIAVGVPDREVAPFLAADLAERGLPVFDPAGKRFYDHPLYHLLDAFGKLVNEGSFAAFGAFLRHPDVLGYLLTTHRLQPYEVLKELDEFGNDHLPVSMNDMRRFLSDAPPKEKPGKSLEKAFRNVEKMVKAFTNGKLDTALRSLLQTVYSSRTVTSGKPRDDEFIMGAEIVDAALREMDMDFLDSLCIDKNGALDLFMEIISTQSYYPERHDATLDLEGWLELPWDDAPFLIVTGMNEGFVPDGRTSDIFLPDSLRRGLKLRSDADRLARDAFLMKGLLESRNKDGRVCFIAGKTTANNNPLKPSRLLFRCPDSELPDRGRRLFGDHEEKRVNYPSTISFRIDVRPPSDRPSGKIKLCSMPVSWFRDFLSCPFRFYLKRMLGMEAIDLEKGEMDALEFGVMVHHALHKMADDTTVRRCADPAQIKEFLCAAAEDWVRAHYGTSPSLPVRIQLDVARKRLAAAARAQAELVDEGWEIAEAEKDIDDSIGGVLVTARIDRIDRHRSTGHVRILDYKTSDRAESPEKVHLGPAASHSLGYARVNVPGAQGKVKERSWLDLQLPLYAQILKTKKEYEEPLEIGYFILPKAVTETGVIMWDDFNDDLMTAARTCAEGVVKDILKRSFWPPAEKVTYDDFRELFCADISECVNLGAFESFMQESRRQ